MNNLYKYFPHIIQDEPNSNIAICLRMILNYAGKDYNVDNIKKTIIDSTIAGISDVKKLCLDLNLTVDYKKMELEEFLSLLDRSIPILVTVPAWGKTSHYLIALYADIDYIYFSDPHTITRRVYIKHSDFKNKWMHSGNEGLIILNPSNYQPIVELK
jgi:ABC-type bacteriocin/lantibiotic exporter with double-glycine peptidase domain